MLTNPHPQAPLRGQADSWGAPESLISPAAEQEWRGLRPTGVDSPSYKTVNPESSLGEGEPLSPAEPGGPVLGRCHRPRLPEGYGCSKGSGDLGKCLREQVCQAQGLSRPGSPGRGGRASLCRLPRRWRLQQDVLITAPGICEERAREIL